MIQFTPRPAPSEVKAFIGQVVTDLSAAFSGVLINVGCELDLYQATGDLGAYTSVALATTLARLMVGAASSAAARFSVVIGTISQGFCGVYQDRLPFADYLKRHRRRPLPAVPCERKRTGS
jgi:hypothetical protein